MSSVISFLFLLLVPINLSNGFAIEPTVETVVIETTTEHREIITDIPEMDIQEAMNLDVGMYTTMVYRYINAQYSMKKEERCYDDYIKCLTSQGIQMPVCAYNNMDSEHGRDYSFKSYCQVYFDNCLRGYRYWRIVNVRFCPWWP